ncbi:hypothetical protein [Asticcacaulis biprosthecium]|uniref:hypothetical protein n=1 Tax=Asticcacaulis biprosthecium TaxID=76891 RepID=UPI00058F1D0A|nr:hypothetical protein [Asticcacaulis biprosthecium]
MVDLWNVPEALYTADIITARVAEALQYAFMLLKQKRTGRAFVRKNLIRDLGINKDTLKIYITPVLDENYRLVSGPTKIELFHNIMLELGVKPWQLYEAAETSNSYREFIEKVSRIVLGDEAKVASANDEGRFPSPTKRAV